MCDICVLKCGGCGDDVETHIGDFCVSRESLQVFCPQKKCRQKAMDRICGRWPLDGDGGAALGISPRDHGAEHLVFSDAVEGRGTFIYLLMYPRDIHTNM